MNYKIVNNIIIVLVIIKTIFPSIDSNPIPSCVLAPVSLTQEYYNVSGDLNQEYEGMISRVKSLPISILKATTCTVVQIFALIDDMDSSDVHVKSDAAFLLGEILVSEYIQNEKVLQEKIIEKLVTGLCDTDLYSNNTRILEICTNVLGKCIDNKIASAIDQIVPLLISDLLTNECDLTRQSQAILLGKCIENGINITKKGFEILGQGLVSPCEFVVQSHADALGKAIQRNVEIEEEYIIFLESMLRDNLRGNETMRRVCAITLAKCFEKLKPDTQKEIINVLSSSIHKWLDAAKKSNPITAISSDVGLKGSRLLNVRSSIDALGSCINKISDQAMKDSIIKIFGLILDVRSDIYSSVLMKYIGTITGKSYDDILKQLEPYFSSSQRSYVADVFGAALESGTQMTESQILNFISKTMHDAFSLCSPNCVNALLKGLNSDVGAVRKSILNILESGLNDQDLYFRVNCAGVLARAIDEGIDVDARIIDLLVSGMKDESSDFRASCARTLGKALSRGTTREKMILSVLENGLHDENINVRQYCAVSMVKRIGILTNVTRSLILDILISVLNSSSSQTRIAACVDAIGAFINADMDIGDAWISVFKKCSEDTSEEVTRSYLELLVKGLNSTLDRSKMVYDILESNFRKIIISPSYKKEIYIDVLVKGLLSGEDARDKILHILVSMLNDDKVDEELKLYCIEIFAEALTNGINITEQGIDILLLGLNHGNWDIRRICRFGLFKGIRSGVIPLISLERNKQYLDFFKEHLETNNIPLDDLQLLYKICMIFITHSNLKTISGNQMRFIDKIIDITPAGLELKIMLHSIRMFSLEKLPQAQTYLENRLQKIISRAGGEINIEPKDDMIIDSIFGSFRENSLISILVGRRFPEKTRVKVMNRLANRGYIDSAYLGLCQVDVQKYLKWIADIYEEFKVVPGKILLDALINGNITKQYLGEKKQELERIVSLRDYKVLVLALKKDFLLCSIYHLIYQSPYQYLGTDSISYERFQSLIDSSSQKLEFSDSPEVMRLLEEGIREIGYSDNQALEIIDSLRRGNAPLPKKSKYLDKNGDFIPQEVDISKQTESNDAIDHAQKDFSSLIENIILLFKITSLLNNLSAVIEYHREFIEEYAAIKDKINTEANLSNILQELICLYNKISMDGRRDKRKIEIILAETLGKQISIMPMWKDMTYGIKKIQPSNEETILFLKNIKISSLIKNMDRMIDRVVKIQVTKLRENGRGIIGADVIDYRVVLKTFINSLFSKFIMEENSPARNILSNLEERLITAYGNYIQAETSTNTQSQSSHVSKKIYVTLIAKYKLMEFFRMADSAHCCISSDPKVAVEYEHGMGSFLKEMPRYLTDTPHFWFEFIVDGKQIGWFECCFGIDEDKKLLVVTELIYLHKSYHGSILENQPIQKALLAKIEEILFSIGVTKIVQADFGHKPSNALPPPDTYEPCKIKVYKLQGLQDIMNDYGKVVSIYEDSPIQPNEYITMELKVLFNPRNGIRLFSSFENKTVANEYLQISA